MPEPLSPAIARLNALPKPKRVYPKGTRQPLTKELATRFCDLISTGTKSIANLLADNPDLPTFKTLETWRNRYPWFKAMWNQARKDQAEFLIQSCIDEARNVTGKTAHCVRVKFDIYRFIASKFSPDTYGEKSNHSQVQNTVNVGISISPERLNDIRTKLNITRTALLKPAQNGHSESSPSQRNRTANDHSPVV